MSNAGVKYATDGGHLKVMLLSFRIFVTTSIIPFSLNRQINLFIHILSGCLTFLLQIIRLLVIK